MINLALIGVGQWGKNIINAVSSIPQCNLKYICAQSKETLESFSDKYIKVTDFQELFKFKDIDGIIIATPGSTHFKIALDCIKRGYNIFIEKPLTTSYKDALKLKKNYDNKKSVVFIGHIYLYNPAILKIKELFDTIGSIEYITFEGSSNGPFRSDMSALWEWAPHGISICLNLMSNKPLTVSAWGINKLRPGTKLFDMFIIHLEFPNKVSTFIKGSWLYPLKKRELVVIGSKSTIVFDDLAAQKLTLYQDIGPSVQKNKVVKNLAKISYPEYDKELSLNKELLEFIECIKGKVVSKTNFNHAIEVIKIIDLAEQSIENNGKLMKIN